MIPVLDVTRPSGRLLKSCTRPQCFRYYMSSRINTHEGPRDAFSLLRFLIRCFTAWHGAQTTARTTAQEGCNLLEDGTFTWG